MHSEIIIIGAGPAGLMAAYELAQQGKKATILEARDHIGGRAHTLYSADGTHTETGAEFVHGKLPISLTLLQLAGLSYTPTGGKWVNLRSGATQTGQEPDGWKELLSKLKGLKEDMTLQAFLEQEFSGSEHAALVDRAIGFAEGYDSADASRASAKALYTEWSKEEEEQYRIDDGYTRLMEFLAAESAKAGTTILLNHQVSSVTFDENGATIAIDGALFTADRVIIALPLGILQKEKISFSPILPQYTDAVQTLGFGDVIKFGLRFKEAFWEEAYPKLGFLMSAATVPTWWTQYPHESSLLTGWMAGRNVRAHATLTEQQLLDAAVQSLAQIFSKPEAEIRDSITEAHVFNWCTDAHTHGSYAYAAVGYQAALATLSEPMLGRIYFAGEYMYDGPAMGTVEAAFWSGTDTARKLISATT